MTGRDILLASIGLALVVSSGCRPPERTAQAPAPLPPPQPVAAAVAAATPTWGCVYVGEGGVYWLPTDESAQPVKLRELGADEAAGVAGISADGARLALIVGEGTGEIIDVANAKTETVLFSDDNMAGALAWSPDGAALAYPYEGQLYVYRNGSKTVLVADKRVTNIAWSPDGSQIAYGRRDDRDQDLGLFVVPASGGRPKQLVKGTKDVRGVGDIAWSPDGKTIAFLHSWEDGALCFVKSDGSGLRADLGPAWGRLQWLQDSSAVVYMAGGAEVEPLGVYRCTPGGKPEAIVRNSAATCDVLADGTLLLCEGSSSEKSKAPVKVSVRSGASKGARVTWSGPIPGSSYAEGRLSPDGAALALAAQDATGDSALWMARLGEDLTRRAEKVESILGWVKR